MAQSQLTVAAIAVLASLVAAVPSAAQDPAAPATPTPAAGDSPGLTGRLRAAFAWLGEHGLHPEVGTVVAGSHLAAGLGVRVAGIAGRPVGADASAMWSIRGYQLYTVQAGLVASRRHLVDLRPADANVTEHFGEPLDRRPGLAVYADLRYRDHPRVDFYGVGPSREDARSDYGVAGTSIDLVAQWQRSPAVGLAGRMGVLDLDVGAGSNDSVPDVSAQFDPDTAPGLMRRPRYLTMGVGGAVDRRDKPGAPTRGSFVGAALWRFHALDDARGFTRVTLDARAYRAISGDRHVIAGRILTSTDWTADGSPTPFYLQQSLGGARSLRGFDDYRFRGEALFHVSIEHRARVKGFLEVAPFLDAGTVSRRLDTLPDAPWHWAWGVGLRLRSDARVFLRMDWAWSRDGQRVVFAVSPAF